MKNICQFEQNVIDHYENPKNVGVLDKKSPNVGTGLVIVACMDRWTAVVDRHILFLIAVLSGLVGAPACGDVMKLQIKVDDKGVIEEAVFKVSN